MKTKLSKRDQHINRMLDGIACYLCGERIGKKKGHVRACDTCNLRVKNFKSKKAHAERYGKQRNRKTRC